MSAEAKILIIDDAVEVRRLAEVVLKKSGFDTRTACDAREGYDAILADMPDLVLLDVMMPGMSGLELYKMLRDHPETANTKVAFMSAIVDQGQVAELAKSGAVGVICKPFKPMALAAEVRALIAKGD